MPTRKQKLIEYLNFKLAIARQQAEEAQAEGQNYVAACHYEDAHEIGCHIRYVESLPD